MLKRLGIVVTASLLASGLVAQSLGPTVQDAQAELAKAEERYRAAIELQPDIAAFHHSLAVVLERQFRTEEALASYARAVQLDSLAARHHAGYGQLLLRAGRPDAGIDHLRRAARLDPLDAESRYTLGRVLIQRQEWTEAAALLQEAARLAPEDERIDVTLREAQSHLQQIQQGRHDLSEFDDESAPNIALTVAEFVFGGVLVGAGLVLLMPVLGVLFLLLIQAPLAWKRGTVSARS